MVLGAACDTFRLIFIRLFARASPGFKFVSEKTSHHPPVCACYAEGPGWEATGSSSGRNKFWVRILQFIRLGGPSLLPALTPSPLPFYLPFLPLGLTGPLA
jgi:Oxysterol-binding protein